MDELVRWLGEQLDEDERIARAAQQNGDVKDGRWFDDEDEEVIDDSGWRIAFTVDAGTRAHLAAHDPARVLREIDAKRQLVKLHGRATLRAGGGAQYFDTTTVCRSCEPSYQFPEQSWPCPTLRLLALPYADRPGYREDWRP